MKVVRTEVVDLGEREIEAHKLEVVFSARGLLGMLGRLVPKTLLWFSVEPPHYLVRFEVVAGRRVRQPRPGSYASTRAGKPSLPVTPAMLRNALRSVHRAPGGRDQTSRAIALTQMRQA